jgi:redox-sensitive bicupin YhaK (pirin superfamily)
MSLRAVRQIIETKPTIEGAGVKLQRAFGFGKTKDFDPFLLLDDFRNEHAAGSRPSRTCLLVRWSTATAWATGER